MNNENTVIRTCLQMGIKTNRPIPESVIVGLSKLLLMDESAIRNFLSDADIRNLEGARKVMADNKLDLKLIKSGLLLLFPLVRPNEEQQEKLQEFAEYVENADADTKATEFVKKALDSAVLPIRDIFAQGNGMDDVFEYQNRMKEANKAQAEAEEDSDDAEASEESDNSDEKEDESHDGMSPEKSSSDNQEKDACESESSGEDEESSKPKFSIIPDLVIDFDSEHAPNDIPKSKSKEEDDSPKEVVVQDLESLSSVYHDLSSALLSVVKGQDQAVRKFVEGCFQGNIFKQTERGKHPRSYFFFFGPPGTGKTLLAETAAEALGIPWKKYDMSDYASNLSHEELIGTSKNYSNSREGVLVKFVSENPECLLIFDEIEKADIGVIRLFLTILGSGYLTSKHSEKDVSFKDTIIIFTSNVGKELYADRSVNLTNIPENVLIDAIRREKNARGDQALPNELCSRIAAGNTILFNHISIRHLAEMVNDNFEKIVGYMGQEYNCNVTYSSKLPLLFLYNRGSEIDARVASGQSGNFIKAEIFELIRQLENRTQKEKVTSINFDIDWSALDDQLKALFINESKAEVLLLSDRKVQELFDKTPDQYVIHFADSIEAAREALKYDLTAVFIDPFFGRHGENDSILSLADYDTEGVSFFHELAEKETGTPIYLIDVDLPFSEVDRRTFLQEGAADTVQLNWDNQESFLRQFEQIMEELYMEKQSQEFSQRGWVIDYKTKQDVAEDGQINILFYDLKKRMAVDMDSRGSMLTEAQRPKVRFSDVIGAEKAKEELQYFVKFLQNPKQFLMNGGKPPKGVLLYGPPGTGKTMLAKAMAGESDVNFIQTSASEFKNKYIGESEANIRKLFAKARKYAPSIIFIDEIDAIGKKRTGSESTSATESMLNTLLTEMDGFSSGDTSKPVFVLAATNFGAGIEKDGISALDEALIRRFDNRIYVDLPKESERKEYIMIMLGKKGIDTVSEKTAQSIAERTTGQSLAILQNVIDLALRNATKESRKMTDADLLTALEEYIYGEKKTHKPEFYREVAIHETGHAFLSYISGDKPSYITIESRGDFGGYMQHANTEEVTGYTREELLSKIRTALAGRASEQVFFGRDKSLNTGASGDLMTATEYAWRIICSYGMEENQLIVLGRDAALASAMAPEYIARVNDILRVQMQKTLEIIEQNKEKIQRIADVLVKENRLTGAQFEELMENRE